MKRIRKIKTLPQVLRELPIGEPYAILNTDYKSMQVRNAISSLKHQGYSFQATEKGYTDRIIVTRLD